MLETFKDVICIDDALSQTFALSYHSRPFYEGGGRTPIGEMVYQSKPYNQPPTPQNRESAKRLAQHFVDFIGKHPSYFQSDLLIAVPPSHPNKPFDLPAIIATEICRQLKLDNGQQCVRKIRKTAPMKDLTTEHQKFNNIRSAFEIIDKERTSGRRITLIDDIYESGATLNELASILQKAGAIVQGLVATKTLKHI